jgi:membrane-bound lytic murein transglycosylase F
MRWNSFLNFTLCYLLLVGCENIQSTNSQDKAKNKKGLGKESTLHAKIEGTLTALMDNSVTSYFIYQGQPLGYEYEMLELFAKENNLTLKIKIIDQVDHILDSLTEGKGDLVAANLSISEGRKQIVNFSPPLFRTRQVLVQRLPDDHQKMTREEIENSLIRDRLDLDHKDVFVRTNSSYELILKNLISETGIDVGIQHANGDMATEQLIEMVSEGEIDYTICDENKAIIFLAYYDNIDIATPMSLSQPIAWAINKHAIELDSILNGWINKRKGSLEFNMITNRYFEMTRREQRFVAKEYDYIKKGNISDYDGIIKKYASSLNWDWRLLTAQIYKESRFDPNTRSWRGAVGLMQLMPKTAKSYGIQPNELLKPEKNIAAGTMHIKMLENQWKEILSDSLEVIKFTLGSYNVGKGHVEDAIRLAEKYGLARDKWDDNVAQMLLNKSIPKYYKDPVVIYGYCRGREPVSYVETILEDYQLYTQFTN